MSSNQSIKTVFISGIFNVLHPGHIRMFRFASELGGRLIIGLQKKASSPINMSDDLERLEALNSISLIDEVLLMDNVPDLLNEIRPDIVVKGKEFKHRFNVEKELVSAWRGKLLFNSGESDLSSINYLPGGGPKDKIPFSSAYIRYVKRHALTSAQLNSSLLKVPKLRVAVVGDIILDEYVECDPVGLSREDPTIVVKPTSSQRFVGGAAIVALHASAFGCEVDFLSIAGNDERANWVKQELSNQNISHHIFVDESRPTTNKKRYRGHNKTLLRVNDYRSHSVENNIACEFIESFKSLSKRCDLVIFSDFSYGLLNKEMVNELQSIARAGNLLMAADSQTSSQRGDLSKFNSLALVTPTEVEARLATDIMDNDVGLAEVIKEVSEQLDVENVLITLGAEGALIMDASDKNDRRLDSLPAFNKYPLDVSGAGDLLLVTITLLLKAGASIWQATLIGMIASGIHVKNVGNRPIDVVELKTYLEGL